MKKIFVIILGLLVVGCLGIFLFRYYISSPNLNSNSRDDKLAGMHYSYFSQPEFFNQAYSSAKSEVYEPNAKAILVNHHLLAGHFIAESFEVVATDSPVTVLLISPNHFSSGLAPIITSKYSWQTPFGISPANTKLIDELEKNNLASVEEMPFEQEHGVSGIVPFIKKSLPNAKIVPVIFNDKLSLAQSLEAADKYFKILPENVLLVGSFDFSHYLSSRAADFHDLENLSDIESFNFNSLYKLDIDSRPGLAFFLELLKNYRAQQFNILEQSNSSKLTKADFLETTSYITGYFTNGEPKIQGWNTLLSLGRVVPSGTLNKKIQLGMLKYLQRLFYGQDNTFAFQTKTDGSIQPQEDITFIADDQLIQPLGPLKVAILNCAGSEKFAIQAIDRGADLAVCQSASKNRVIFYKSKLVIYAAGDLLNDKLSELGQKSMAVGLAYKDDSLRVVLFPIANDKGELKLLVGAQSDIVLTEMANNSLISPDLKKQILKGQLQLITNN
ncbi:MAG: AmmeMemoRadiSam system protein B [Candidatus Doudnabacteria bacterium]|nr:AmmeMemoRadiSam system protein B [Candidatus Doudnabacteria bacterium]